MKWERSFDFDDKLRAIEFVRLLRLANDLIDVPLQIEQFDSGNCWLVRLCADNGRNPYRNGMVELAYRIVCEL